MAVRLLYVEDYALVREAMLRGLEQHFLVTAAEDGQEALELIQSQDFDVVLTDFDMPRLDGLQLYEKAVKVKPELKFIVLSGRSLPNLPVRSLMKPCSLATLRQTIQEVTA